MNNKPTNEWISTPRPQPSKPLTSALYREPQYTDVIRANGSITGVYPKIRAITLDRTIFCPEQPEQRSDIGVIRAGTKRVRLDIERVIVDPNGEIYHIVAPKHKRQLEDVGWSAAKGDPAEMFVDPVPRSLAAATHTAEHLVRHAVAEATEGGLIFDSGGTLDERGYQKYCGHPGLASEALRRLIQANIDGIQSAKLPREHYFTADGVRAVGFGSLDPIACEGLHVKHTGMAPRISIDNVHTLREGNFKKIVVMSSTY